MKIANGVYVLEVESEVLMGPRKVYPVVVAEGEKLVLFDTCFPGQYDILVDELTKIGFNVKNITKVALTHQDIDHTGNMAEILAVTNNVKVLAHRAEEPYINGTKTPLKLAKLEANYDNLPDNLKQICEGFKKGFAKNRVDVDKLLDDGEVLDLVGGIEVIYTPGHTVGHTCYYFTDIKMLIAGDMLTIKDGELAIADESIHHDYEEVKKSVQKLLKYDIETVVTFHGGVYTGGANTVNDTIEKLVN